MHSFLGLCGFCVGYEKYQHICNVFSGQQVDLDLENLFAFAAQSYAAAQFLPPPPIQHAVLKNKLILYLGNDCELLQFVKSPEACV